MTDTDPNFGAVGVDNPFEDENKTDPGRKKWQDLVHETVTAAVVSAVGDAIAARDTEARDWRKNHDIEARDRHVAIANLFESDRQQNRADHVEFRARFTSLETTGVPLEAWKLVKGATKDIVRFAAIVAICAVVISVGVYAEFAWRVYAFEKAPVMHVLPAAKADPQVERR